MVRFIESDMGDGFTSLRVKQWVCHTSGYSKHVNLVPLSHSDIHHNIWFPSYYPNGGCQPAWCNNQSHAHGR